MKSSAKMLSRAEELDFSMLAGVYYTEVHEQSEYIIAWHNKTADCYSNFAGRVRCKRDGVSETLAEVKRYFSERNRNTTILVTPFTEPADLSVFLAEDGFQLNYQDVWMFFRGSCDSFTGYPAVAIETVDSLEGMSCFVETFNRAYSGTSSSEPYGIAPPEWGETLYSGFNNPRQGRKVDYYVLYEQGEPASVLLTSSMESFAGIYSVGTVSNMRGKGHASTLTLYAVEQLRKQGISEIFLQTKKNSLNERLYTRLGFATEWEAESWSKVL